MPSVRPGDFRSEAKDRQRVKSHNAKWCRGSLPAVGKRCESDPFGFAGPCDECAKRPWGGRAAYKESNRFHGRVQTQMQSAMHRDFEETQEDNSDGSVAGDVANIAEPDTEVMYSFDAHAGPGHGSQILSHAIVQAVARFENKETEKIVKEYDLVADGKEEVEFADAEDDFELVGPATWQ